MNACKKSCCWTPFDACARQHTCGCHTGGQPIYERLTLEELNRAQAISTSKKYTRKN